MNTIRFASALALAVLVCQQPVTAQTTIELDQDGNPFLSIPLDDSQPVTIDPETGELRATAASGFSCTTGGCEDVQVSFASADGGFFLVDGDTSTSVTETGSVTFDWGAPGAFECQGTGLPGTTWNNPGKLPFGPFSVSVSNLDPGNSYQAGLTCSNGAANEDSALPVQVTVQESTLQIPVGCEGRQPGDSEATKVCANFPTGPSTTIDCSSYESLFGAFPGNIRARTFFTNANEFVALKFTFDNAGVTRGTWARETPQISPTTSGPRFMTISKCPGDFDQDKIRAEMGSDDCYIRATAGSGQLLWKAENTSGAACELELGQEYWLNMMYSTDPEGTDPIDLQWACGDEAGADGCSDSLTPTFQ